MAPIISGNIRVRLPDSFTVGPHSIVDDFCYFSTRIEIGFCSHVATGCSVGGGDRFLFRLGDFSSVSAGVRIWCASNDFVNDLITVVSAAGCDIGDSPIEGDVIFGDYTGIGSNSVVMPDNKVPEGTAIGALSFVPPRFAFDPWSVYAGVPIRRIGGRNRERVLAQVELLRRRMHEG